MSAFGQGLQFGLIHGMFNNMFGLFGFGRFGGFGGCCGNPFYSFNDFGFFGRGFFNYSPYNFFSTPIFNMPTFITPAFNNYCNYSYPQSNNIFEQNNIYNNINTLPAISSTNTNTTITANTYTQSTVTDTFISSNTSKSTSKSTGTSINISADTKQYNAQELKKMWQKKKPDLNLSNTFYDKIISISNKIECNPNDLMGIINIETNGTFNPSIQNPNTKATGLIQFMPQYVSSYGTSIEELKNMTAEQQLDYVEKYFVINKRNKKLSGKLDAGTLYALVFYPALVSGGSVKKGDAAYNQNKVLDINNDGEITLSDLSEKVKKAQA